MARGGGGWPGWTPAEDETIRAIYPDGGPAGVLGVLKERTLAGIYTRAGQLGVRRALRAVPETKEQAASWWGLRVNRERARLLFWAKVEMGPGCWLWLGTRDRDDYGRFQVSIPGQNRQVSLRAHAFAWEDENGPVPLGLQLTHGCDTPGCVRPAADHVRPGDQSTNLVECVARRRHPPTRLTPEQVVEIRRRVGAGETVTAVAQDLGRPRPTVYSVIHGRTWGWLT